MKKLVIFVLILIVQNLNGKEFKIKGDYLYIKGSVKISETDHFNVSDYNSIEIFAYYKTQHDDLLPKYLFPKRGNGTRSENIRLEKRIKAETPSTVGAVDTFDGVLIVIGKTTIDQGGQYNLKIKTEELKLYRFMTKKRKINSENINIKIKSPKYSSSHMIPGIGRSNYYSFTNEKLIKKNTFELSPFVLDIREEWVRIYKINNLKYNINKMTGPYDADGFTDFFADGNNYFLWNSEDYKRGMYRSVDSGENWGKMTWNGIKYIPSKVYKYDDEYLFQYTLEDNPDGVWNSYDYDKKVWSVYEIDEFELKIFNAEKDNWEKEFNSQESKKFPIKNTRKGVYYKDYKHNFLLPYNISSKEKRKYQDSELVKPLLYGTIYNNDDDVFLLNTYGLFKLMTESDIQSSSNYNKMIHDNFIECKSLFESDLKSQSELEEKIKRYKETKSTFEERKIIHKDLKQELKKEYDWLNKMKGWEEDATLVEEERKKIEIEYKKRLNNYNELDYRSKQLNDYLQKTTKWLSSKKIEIDSLKKLITDEVRSFPMFYPVRVNGINPSEISDIKLKNDELYVITSLNNGKANKLFLYDGKWHTIFDPITNDLVSDSRLSIEMLDNIDDIIFISPSSKTNFPNNIYYLNHKQDNSIKNNENKYELLTYRDETGRSIEHVYTDKSGKLWTIEKNTKSSRKSDYYGGETYTYFLDYQLYRYNSLSDLSDPLLIQEWKTFYVGKDSKGTYDPETQIPTAGWDKSPISSVKLVKTDDNTIYLIKDNTIKQIGAGRDKDFISRHNILSSIGARVSISDSLVDYTFFPYKNDVIMFNYFDHFYREREYDDLVDKWIKSKLVNFFHIQRGVNKKVNQNVTSAPSLLRTQLGNLKKSMNAPVTESGRIKARRGDVSYGVSKLYYFDKLANSMKLFEIRKKNGFVDEDFHIDSELRNGYNTYGHTRRYKHEGGRGTYKIRCSIGNNDEILIYNYPTGIYYLKNGEFKDMKPFDYFDKMKVSEITNDKDGYLIGTYSSGLYKVSIVTN
jgi:hypothetical protein